ncbi:MAG: class I SAM-dependent methyltransferase [Candidatus Omnitrophica bacterium]|jgi:23S rRNA G2069 N7-methylase RlmK/C1962 C5-methylase RlmI|nr:class I SAM-dependent methyltransferase [Candidatus Omnitrophota bacterium]
MVVNKFQNQKYINDFAQEPLKGFVTPEKAKMQAETLANSLKKKFRHLSRRFKREGIDCFRLYDWDSPDIRIVVDWYAGHIVVSEYERKQTGPGYLPQMARAAAQALNVSKEKVHIRRRHTNVANGPRYNKVDSRGERIKVQERNLKFWVNLSDFLDTGLFSDHRGTRVIISRLAKDKDFLNLFAYTGTFTCAAAAGSARTTATVDRSQSYIKWAKDNMVLNGFLDKKHIFIQSDVKKYLSCAQTQGKRFSLVFVDPPSFYKNEREGVSFDINRDHPELIRDVLKIVRPGSDVFFSTNHQRFEPRFNGITVKEINKLTPETIPEDYRNRNVHNCWQFKI